MAKKYLDYDGLSYFWLQLKNKLTGKLNDVNYDTTNKKLYKTKEGTNTDIVSVSTLKTDMALTKADVGLGNVTDGAQVNVLEGIQKNGQTVTITNKIANISVPTKTSDITNDSGFITISDVPEGAAASATTPKMDGTAAVGTQTAFARGDHVHPTDTSRAPVSHASSATTYGIGTGSNYGHVKLSDATNGTATAASGGTAASPKAVADALQAAKDYADGLDTGVSDVTVDGTSVVSNGVAAIDLTGKQATITGAATTITSSNLTASKALISNSSGKVAISSVSSTELGYVAGVTSAIQTQINGKAPLASPALTGTPTAPTATAGTNSTQIATTAFVASAIQTAQTGAAAFQGTAPTTFAPTNYKKGYYWVVGTAGTYAGETCEPGDMIFAVADYNSAYSANDFNVIQTNLDITSITNTEIDTIVAS